MAAFVRVRAYAKTLLRYRTLAAILVQRELTARYRGTALGFLWSFVNPLMMAGIYVFVFSVTIRLPVPHYGAFVLAGLLPWNGFVAGLTEGMHALLANGNLIKKVALPAEVFPTVAVVANTLHFVFSLPVLFLVLVCSGVAPQWTWLLVPVLVLEQLVYALAGALLLSSLVVQFRDLLHIVPNLVMMLFYVTPIVYPAEMVPAALRAYVAYNPLAASIGAYRQALLLGEVPSLRGLAARLALASVALFAALWTFRSRRDLYPELT